MKVTRKTKEKTINGMVKNMLEYILFKLSGM